MIFKYIYCDSSQEYAELVDSLRNADITFEEWFSEINREIVANLKIQDWNLQLECRWMFSQSDLPNSVIDLMENDIKSDLIFCNQNKEVELIIEVTSTAPVGNAMKQRSQRYMYPINNEIPFLFISASEGIDQSQGTRRTETGIFKLIKDYYPDNFMENSSSVLSDILKKYILEDQFLSSITPDSSLSNDIINKTTAKAKKFFKYSDILSYDKEEAKLLFNQSSLCETINHILANSVSVIESVNIFKMSSENFIAIFPHIEINRNQEVIIFINRLIKTDGSYSDPAQGNANIVKSFFPSDRYTKIAISTHPVIDGLKEIFRQRMIVSSKLTRILSDFDIVFDADLDIIPISRTINNFIYNPKIGESDVSLAYEKLLPLGSTIHFRNYPGGSWGSTNNNQHRDEDRPDLKYSLPNHDRIVTVESKSTLKGIKEDIEKKGDIWDEYVFYEQDCDYSEVQTSGKLFQIAIDGENRIQFRRIRRN
tara:strand:+ start:1663 stop:3105 length:1443 start_codon:yes stop_codon:yes gene_type:complete